MTHNQPTDKLRTNTGRMLLVLALFLGVGYYSTVAFSTRDPFWFGSSFAAKPSRMIVYHNGAKREIQSGQAEFAALADAVQSSLAQGVSHASGIGFSPETLSDAYGMYTTLEVFFDSRVKLHATFATGEPNQMLFPITGRHSEQPLVLLGLDGQYMVNAPVLKTIEPIRTLLHQMGYQ